MGEIRIKSQTTLGEATNSFRTELFHIREGFLVAASILNLDSQIILVTFVFLRQVACVLKVACLSTNSNGSVEVERWLLAVPFMRLGLDERVQPLYVFQFGIRIEEKRGVVCVGEATGMKFLKEQREVIDAFCVEELRVNRGYRCVGAQRQSNYLADNVAGL